MSISQKVTDYQHQKEIGKTYEKGNHCSSFRGRYRGSIDAECSRFGGVEYGTCLQRRFVLIP